MKTTLFIEGAVPRYARTKPGEKSSSFVETFFALVSKPRQSCGFDDHCGAMVCLIARLWRGSRDGVPFCGTPYFFAKERGKPVELTRYSVIEDKNPREIVLLRGRGCAWKRCRFCDYHLDASRDEQANLALNRAALAQVTGRYGRLEAINSGSFAELEESTIREVERVCREKGIRDLHIESHWLFRKTLPALRARFAEQGITLHVKIGVETFDADYRERVLDKGIDETDPAKIAADFDDCCLLFGLAGQTADSMRHDIETGLAHFDRVCVNIMVPNTTSVRPDDASRAAFVREVYPFYRDNPRVDILLENTDFGVGEVK